VLRNIFSEYPRFRELNGEVTGLAAPMNGMWRHTKAERGEAIRR
jgi:hypothetical protein